MTVQSILNEIRSIPNDNIFGIWRLSMALAQVIRFGSIPHLTDEIDKLANKSPSTISKMKDNIAYMVGNMFDDIIGKGRDEYLTEIEAERIVNKARRPLLECDSYPVLISYYKDMFTGKNDVALLDLLNCINEHESRNLKADSLADDSYTIRSFYTKSICPTGENYKQSEAHIFTKLLNGEHVPDGSYERAIIKKTIDNSRIIEKCEDTKTIRLTDRALKIYTLIKETK